MATIIVEDGTVVSGANSYISEADCTTYATDRGVTLSGVVADMLIQAMDFIEGQNFKGTKKSSSQSLVWPRYGVVVDSYSIQTDEIPQLLKDALCEVVIGIDSGVNPLANETRETDSETVADISVTYSKSARNYEWLKAADYKLKKLIHNQMRVIRA